MYSLVSSSSRLAVLTASPVAVIAGASSYVSPKATLAALVPGFNYFAIWYVLAAVASLFIGIETKGRTLEELDAALVARAPIKAAAQ